MRAGKHTNTLMNLGIKSTIAKRCQTPTNNTSIHTPVDKPTGNMHGIGGALLRETGLVYFLELQSVAVAVFLEETLMQSHLAISGMSCIF